MTNFTKQQQQTQAEPLNLDEKHFMRILQMTDDTAKIEASLANSGEAVRADHVVVAVVEDECKSYRWFWSSRGWIKYLNEAKLYTCEEAKRVAKIFATRTDGHPIISPVQNEIDLAQRQAHGVITDEHRYVTKSKQLRQGLTDALDAKGIGYTIPENTSAVIVGVAGRGNVGVSQYGEVRYTVWSHGYGYGNGECKNVGTIDEVVALFN